LKTSTFVITVEVS